MTDSTRKTRLGLTFAFIAVASSAIAPASATASTAAATTTTAAVPFWHAGYSTANLIGPFHVVNGHSNKCLTVLGAGGAENTSAVQFTCDKTYPFNEDWYLEDLSAFNKYFHIRNQHSGKCLTVLGASKAENAKVVQFTCDYTFPFNEQWYLVDLSPADGYYHIVNRNSNKCLTVLGASGANNASAVQFTCDKFPPYNEKWVLS
ncbi:RICIN domain-containing protein [Microbispora rosea]|uniref:RICIN domain-containing protein n=1 Tax=Microbispora rosea TaxID=58117 RepID=UPI0037CCA83B